MIIIDDFRLCWLWENWEYKVCCQLPTERWIARTRWKSIARDVQIDWFMCKLSSSVNYFLTRLDSERLEKKISEKVLMKIKIPRFLIFCGDVDEKVVAKISENKHSCRGKFIRLEDFWTRGERNVIKAHCLWFYCGTPEIALLLC